MNAPRRDDARPVDERHDWTHAEVPHEPVARQRRHLLERAGLLEQVRRAGNDLESRLAGKQPLRLLVESEHLRYLWSRRSAASEP